MTIAQRLRARLRRALRRRPRRAGERRRRRAPKTVRPGKLEESPAFLFHHATLLRIDVAVPAVRRHRQVVVARSQNSFLFAWHAGRCRVRLMLKSGRWRATWTCAPWRTTVSRQSLRSSMWSPRIVSRGRRTPSPAARILGCGSCGGADAPRCTRTEAERGPGRPPGRARILPLSRMVSALPGLPAASPRRSVVRSFSPSMTSALPTSSCTPATSTPGTQ